MTEQLDDIRQIIAIHCEDAPLSVLPLSPQLVSSFSQVPSEQRTELLDALLDSALDGILAYRTDGTLVYHNSAMDDMLGYTAEEFAALPAFGWVAVDSPETGPLHISSFLENAWIAYEGTCIAKDSSIVPTEVRARRVETHEGPLVVSVVRDISQRQAAQRHLLFMAFHDPLTSLANRSLLEDRLGTAIADSRRHGDTLGAAYIDLDDFKPVNDRYGHAIGDAVLVEVARRLKTFVRVQDTVARLGGDEFLVLLPRLRSALDLPTIGEKLCNAIEAPITIGEHEIRITASIGLTIFEPDADDARSLIVKADCAMYEAKNLGFSGCRFSVEPTLLLADEGGVTA